MSIIDQRGFRRPTIERDSADRGVGALDLRIFAGRQGKAGFSNAQLNETGRPPYDPGDLLRLYLYGYLNRVRSGLGLGSRSDDVDFGGEVEQS